ncbi:rRNA maturation RNase YbeY [Candidatus Rickettsiella viridis]
MPNTKIKKKQIKIAIQDMTRRSFIPNRYYFQRWVNKALINRTRLSEITIRLVDRKESTDLNEAFRHKKGPTNILSFPFEPPPEVYSPLLGDLVIYAGLVNQEAKQQKKTRLAHWAHLVIHGCLHLIGYDHENEKDATKMETLEIQLLQELGYANPYL